MERQSPDLPESESTESSEDRAVFTGYMADSERRIDLVLVIPDDGIVAADEVRVRFLINALKLGLQLEIEPGLMKEHKHLMFVKVHAPEAVIEEQGEHFRVRRYFKDSRVEFVNTGNGVIKFLRRLLPCIFNCYEKEWVKIARLQYPGAMNYSTLERSLIVYRMLLLLPFGNYRNYVGLNRLIKNNLILDAFALHDGPYFFIPNQNILRHVNGRQILFANWVGGGNLFKLHPVSMIQEYLGERIAFYFTFTEYYIIALSVPVVAGNVCLYFGVYNGLLMLKEIDSNMKKRFFDIFCSNEGNVNIYHGFCPTCKDWVKCPFRWYSELCTEVILKSMVTSPKLLSFYAIVTVWAIMFVCLWKRREYYFRWLWETDDEALTNTYRPEYKISISNLRRSRTTGMWTNYESISTRATRIAFNLVIFTVCVGAVYFLTLFWANFQYDMVKWLPLVIYKMDVSLYSGIAATTAIYSIMVTVLGKVTVLLSRLVVQFENHRHQESLEQSMIGKMVIFTFVVTFWYLAFLAFVKGRLFTYPGDVESFTTPGGIGMMHCTFFGCVDQLTVTVLVFAFVRFIILKGLFYWLPITTDYNQGYTTNATIPIWEREYKMSPITEQDIREMFLELTMQFAFITMFSGAFSPISLFILIANIWDVRYKARLLLVGRRRPLLFKCSGIGAWLTWWQVIAYAAILSNAFMCAYNTRIVLEYIADLLKDRGGFNFYDYNWNPYSMSILMNAPSPIKEHVAYYKEKVKYMPISSCMYPRNSYIMTKDCKGYEESMYCDYIKYYELVIVILFELSFCVIAWLLTHIIPARSKDIEETLKVEERIKTECYIRRKRTL